MKKFSAHKNPPWKSGASKKPGTRTAAVKKPVLVQSLLDNPAYHLEYRDNECSTCAWIYGDGACHGHYVANKPLESPAAIPSLEETEIVLETLAEKV